MKLFRPAADLLSTIGAPFAAVCGGRGRGAPLLKMKNGAASGEIKPKQRHLDIYIETGVPKQQSNRISRKTGNKKERKRKKPYLIEI